MSPTRRPPRTRACAAAAAAAVAGAAAVDVDVAVAPDAPPAADLAAAVLLAHTAAHAQETVRSAIATSATFWRKQFFF